ncbi:FecR domain-containing protein [uncultured Sphingomonas sp.]|uniref:FecR family protein n=1 Tax=uncultured Sphingomonas sp. TaxID=158754 RepID=UPI0025FD71CB|nr:FecR domain-containing protein [uncultured Sphingomonas sp.]
MTNAEEPTEGAAEALAREAAHRFARTRGPDAEVHRAELEAWLAEAPEHRAAYNRAAEIFAMGKLLSEPDAPPSLAAPEPKRGRKVLVAMLTTITACAIGVGGWITYQSSAPTSDRPAALADTTDNRTLSTSTAPQTVQLADGSTVTLAVDTMVGVEIATGVRQLRLLRGKARFEVAHERRPFIVLAGGGSVTARGTIFEVALAPAGRVEVRLLRGAVDVAMPRGTAKATPAIRRLAPGQEVTYSAEPEHPAARVTSAGAAGLQSDTPQSFEAVPVQELIALANRTTSRPIRLAEPSLGARRVSGWFRVDDTLLLARRLGALLCSDVDLRDAHQIVVVPQEGHGSCATREAQKQAAL